MRLLTIQEGNVYGPHRQERITEAPPGVVDGDTLYAWVKAQHRLDRVRPRLSRCSDKPLVTLVRSCRGYFRYELIP